MLKINEYLANIIIKDTHRNLKALNIAELTGTGEQKIANIDFEKWLLSVFDIEEEIPGILSILLRRDQFINLSAKAYYYHVSELVESINKYITYDFPFHLAFTENKAQIFISFTEKDYLIVEAFRQLLIEHCIDKDCIYFSSSPDDLHMQPGENYIHNIQHNIKESDIIVCVLSSDYHQSSTCYYELGYATALEKLILPVHAFKKVQNGQYFSDKSHIENIVSVKYMKKMFAFFGVQLNSDKFTRFVKEIHQITSMY